jgi:hypothetical protein
MGREEQRPGCVRVPVLFSRLRGLANLLREWEGYTELDFYRLRDFEASGCLHLFLLLGEVGKTFS